MGYMLQTIGDIVRDSEKGIVGVFPEVKCGQHGDATRVEELNIEIDWNNMGIVLNVIDVCEFCNKPVGETYFIRAVIVDE